MILGLLSMVVANAACLLGTHAVWRRCRTGRPSADAALFLLLRFALASAAVLAAGLAGVLNAGALGLAGAAALGGLLLLGEHRHVRRPEPSALRRVPPLLLAVAALFVARLLVQVWFRAPLAGDPVWYHLPKVAEWIQAGRITAETGLAWRSHFPGGFELFEIWWCVFLHHDALIEMAGLEAWLMAFAALVAVARWSGLDHHGAFLAALLLGAAPVSVMQAVSGYNDLPTLALFLAALALVLERVHPLLLAVPIGIGIGVKPTFGFALPGLLLLAWLVRKEGARAPRPALGPTAALATLALGLGAYWYVRNWALYGNPIHPGTSRGFIEGTVVQQVGPDLLSLKENLRRLIDSRIYDSLKGYSPHCEFAANWGPAIFAAGLPGLLLALREDRRFRTLALGVGTSAVAVLLLVLSDPWFTRFVLFIPALLSIAAARLGLALRGVSVMLAACVGYQFIGSLASDRLAAEGEMPMFYRQSWRSRASDLLADDFPRGERSVATCGEGHLDYLLYGPDFSRKVHYVRADGAEAIVSEMRRLGVGVIQATGTHVPIVEAGVKRKLLRPLSRNLFCLPEWQAPPATSPSGRP